LPPNTHIYFPHHPSLAKCQNKINLWRLELQPLSQYVPSDWNEMKHSIS
jgi:hypothetical protein